MFTIELYSQRTQIQEREDNLIQQGYKRIERSSFFSKVISPTLTNKVRIFPRTGIGFLQGYNPQEIRFFFIPDQSELDLAQSRVKSKNGKVFIFHIPQK